MLNIGMENYDSWKNNDCRAEQLDNTKYDYYIEQSLIEEVYIDHLDDYIVNFKENITDKYELEELEVAEINILDKEYTGDTVIVTVSVLWTNISIVEDASEEDLKNEINQYIDLMWEDERTDYISYEIEEI
ncbi:hypothetical protein KQI68_07215 [Peptoniphilus sp. MSJ-1]|uniref:Uncharacterized protein n=1 Tax=Peptoniphilus ovalis TaxID=2841503 RepID=A0ABS6FJK5_9FIRM|nr:hypothetical protein [Peptoniphilus ovalis]MBU5669628.1 hypothetical protein [Peptoniphilus ovalis]